MYGWSPQSGVCLGNILVNEWAPQSGICSVTILAHGWWIPWCGFESRPCQCRLWLTDQGWEGASWLEWPFLIPHQRHPRVVGRLLVLKVCLSAFQQISPNSVVSGRTGCTCKLRLGAEQRGCSGGAHPSQEDPVPAARFHSNGRSGCDSLRGCHGNSQMTWL